MREVPVAVQHDYLERLARARPLVGLAELIWNALDADATEVEVELVRNDLGGLAEVRVTDDGHGMLSSEVDDLFANLGGSWKSRGGTTKSGRRALHGKKGEGRFKAFAMGPAATWTSVAETVNGPRHRVRVQSSQQSLKAFSVSEPEETGDDPGTEVLVVVDPKVAAAFQRDAVLEYLATQFAVYLEKYPDVSLTFDGESIDHDAYIERSHEESLEAAGFPDAKLRIIEWKPKFDRALVLCDQEGFALADEKVRIQAPGFRFTAYLMSPAFGAAAESGDLEAWELDEALSGRVDAARARMRDYFEARSRERSSEVVDRWKQEDVYPFREAPASPVEQLEREVFDAVAVAVNDRISDFPRSSPESKRLSLSLIREAIEQNPGALNRILQEVLQLNPEEQDDFADLLEKASLGALIKAAKKISDRLEFLLGLETLVFDPASKKQLLERSQLHKILEEETWIFGEALSLTVSDQSLNEVLRKHLGLLDRSVLAAEPVEIPEQTDGIVDLQLARVASDHHARRECLVVELKRPSCKIKSDEITQIKKYAFAVAGDARFSGTDTVWNFWIVSNELDRFAEQEAEQDDRPRGLIWDKGQIRVWVKTWGDIIEAARRRMSFYQQELNYSPSLEQARDYLRSRHGDLLPPALAAVAEDDLEPGGEPSGQA